MSAVFDAAAKALSATFSGTIPANNKTKLLVAWVKWAAGQSHNSLNCASELNSASGKYHRVTSNGTPLMGANVNVNTNATVTVAGTYVEDAWMLAGVFIPADVNGFLSIRAYHDGVTNNVSSSSDGTHTEQFETLIIGQGQNFNDFSRWKGKIAEVSVWEPADQTEADAIMAELATLKADAVTGNYSPIWYASLESDATVIIGAALTNNGSTTFDGADNPSLSGGDTTAPVLTSAVGTTTGATTATVGATTDEANGTLYVVVTGSATQPSIAQIKAGQDHTGAAAAYASSQAVSTTGAKTFNATGLAASTTYYAHLVHTDAAANDSNCITSASFTTDTPDTTAPTLTSGVGTVESNALIVVGVTTDEANGTMYAVLTTAATPPSATQVRNGQDHTGAAAVFAANQAIGSTGAKTFNATGLTQLTGYYPYIVHRDAAGNDSAVLSIGLRTTFRDGATGQFIVDNTGPVGDNPAGIMYNDVVLPGDADKWFSYRIVSGPTTPADFDFNADGSFIYSGTTGDSFDYQLEVDGVDTGAPQTVTVSAADITAPTLTSPTAAATGATTASGSVSTNEGNGTLYWLASANAGESADTVKGGSSQAVSGTGVQNVSVTGLTAATSYYLHFVHRDTAGNDSTVSTSAQFTTEPPPDTTPPTLSSASAVATGATSSSGQVSTNEANGTLYWLTNTSASATAVAVKAGSSQAVSATGVQNTTSSGLSASTAYYTHFLHRDAAGNDSTVATTASFTTSAAPPGSTSGIVRHAIAMRVGL